MYPDPGECRGGVEAARGSGVLIPPLGKHDFRSQLVTRKHHELTTTDMRTVPNKRHPREPGADPPCAGRRPMLLPRHAENRPGVHGPRETKIRSGISVRTQVTAGERERVSLGRAPHSRDPRTACPGAGGAPPHRRATGRAAGRGEQRARSKKGGVARTPAQPASHPCAHRVSC